MSGKFSIQYYELCLIKVRLLSTYWSGKKYLSRSTYAIIYFGADADNFKEVILKRFAIYSDKFISEQKDQRLILICS